MRERDIVDFTKMIENENGEFVDENGEEIGCKICHTHEKAYEKFVEKIEKHPDALTNEAMYGEHRSRHICPKCGELLVPHLDCTDNFEMAVVSEENVSIPDGRIGYYAIYECTNEKCVDSFGNRSIFAMMPEPVNYNGNHDIFYTGGRTYLKDKDMIELAKNIFKGIQPSIEQYIQRKLHPENDVDKNLDMGHVELWASRDVEEVLANWFYEHGLKK